MSKNGYWGDFESFADEQREYEKWMERNREPDIVPCFKCKQPMYQVSEIPEKNICEKCEV